MTVEDIDGNSEGMEWEGFERGELDSQTTHASVTSFAAEKGDAGTVLDNINFKGHTKVCLISLD